MFCCVLLYFAVFVGWKDVCFHSWKDVLPFLWWFVSKYELGWSWKHTILHARKHSSCFVVDGIQGSSPSLALDISKDLAFSSRNIPLVLFFESNAYSLPISYLVVHLYTLYVVFPQISILLLPTILSIFATSLSLHAN